jgi:hypothetical protein
MIQSLLEGLATSALILWQADSVLHQEMLMANMVRVALAQLRENRQAILSRTVTSSQEANIKILRREEGITQRVQH